MAQIDEQYFTRRLLKLKWQLKKMQLEKQKRNVQGGKKGVDLNGVVGKFTLTLSVWNLFCFSNLSRGC
jgi:hypothetical protein